MQNCWVLQENPRLWDFLGWCSDPAFERKGRLLFWTARQHRKEIRYGDSVFIYIGGKREPGIYAFGRVASDIVEIKEPIELGGNYWSDPTDNREEPRVLVRIECYRKDTPLIERATLQKMGIPVGFQGTVRGLTHSQGRTLVQAVTG